MEHAVSGVGGVGGLVGAALASPGEGFRTIPRNSQWKDLCGRTITVTPCAVAKASGAEVEPQMLLNLVRQQVLEIEFQVFPDFLLKRLFWWLSVFANTCALLIYGDVSRNFLRPTSAVVVINAVAHQAESFVGMASKNALSASRFPVCKRTIGNLSR